MAPKPAHLPSGRETLATLLVVLIAANAASVAVVAAPVPSSRKTSRSSAICNSVDKCNYSTAQDVNAALKWHTASFTVTVDDGGGGGNDDSYYDDDPTTGSACQTTDLVNPIGAVTWDCLMTEAGSALASVGCPEEMQAVSVSCVFSLAGLFIPVSGATSALQGDSATCAFPPRSLIDVEWSSLPYAILLSCSNNQVPLDAAGRAKAISTSVSTSTSTSSSSSGSQRQPDTMLRVLRKRRRRTADG